MSNYIYILISAAVTFLVRVIPLTIIRRPIKSRFIRSFLFYVPYITLAVMTFPAMIQATSIVWAGAAAMVVGIIVAWRGGGLFKVTIFCCVTAFLVEILHPYSIF